MCAWWLVFGSEYFSLIENSMCIRLWVNFGFLILFKVNDYSVFLTVTF